jgi:hypothetical protein
MEENNKLAVILTGQESWNDIVNQITAELAEGELPDRVIQATEYLLAGFPMHKAARKVNVSTQTVRSWLTRYPTMAAVVANSRQILSVWRMTKLEQQFLSAINRSQEILDVDLGGTADDGTAVDPKVLTVVAAQARYIIGLFAGQKVDVTVTHELGDTVMKARNDALDYLAVKLAEQQEKAALGEPVEAVYRVMDSKVDDQGPMLDEDGNPPFGSMGLLDKDDDGIQCHICGRRFKNLAKHLLTKHGATAEEYETLYLLEEGQVRKTEEY